LGHGRSGCGGIAVSLWPFAYAVREYLAVTEGRATRGTWLGRIRVRIRKAVYEWAGRLIAEEER